MIRVVRPARMADLPAVMDLARTTGGGMTTFPAHEPTLKARISNSEAALGAAAERPGDEAYLFVMEKDGAIVGSCGIIATVGVERPFYNYRQLKITQKSNDLGVRVNARALMLMNDFSGFSEIATLFLRADARGGGAGLHLARSRYLFIADHRARFSDDCMAEIRGWVDGAGRSPFWEAIGRKFFQMDMAAADTLDATGDNQFIADLMPKYPIYVELLPEDAQAVIGRPHDESVGAKRLLERDGFRYEGAIDIFDAGPALHAPTDDIRAIRESRVLPYAGAPRGKTARMIAAAGRLQDYRCVALEGEMGEDAVRFDASYAEALRVGVGDPVRAVLS